MQALALMYMCANSYSVHGWSCAERARSEQNFITDMHLHQVAALPAGALQRLHEEMLAEHRMRLIAGLKRYFHRKRHEGLLSSQGLRLLDNACDTCTDAPLDELDVFIYMHKVCTQQLLSSLKFHCESNGMHAWLRFYDVVGKAAAVCVLLMSNCHRMAPVRCIVCRRENLSTGESTLNVLLLRRTSQPGLWFGASHR
jgi:hypothetical protein